MKNKLIVLLILLVSIKVYAVRLSGNNTGEVLIFPYYTVNGEFNTFINISNTTQQSKALRVRFREAANGREVFAFNLYLGPNDGWSAGLAKTQSLEGLSTYLATSDQSCTTPLLGSDLNAFYTDNFTGDAQDAYGTDINRLFEGFIEIIEMGVVTGDSAMATVIEGRNSAPDCQRLHNAWYGTEDDNYWALDASVDMLPASGGIAAEVILLDIEQGISMTQKPTVINDFSDEILHYAVENASPNFADAKRVSTVIDISGKTTELQWSTGFEAVSSVLSTARIMNEYVLDEVIDAKTDWILTMPTRHFHVQEEIIKPFELFDANISKHCEPFFYLLYDRQGNSPAVPTLPPPGVFSPQSVLCYATSTLNIVSFRDLSELFPLGVFDSNFPATDEGRAMLGQAVPIISPYENGWLNLFFIQSALAVDENYKVNGLPIIGFAANKLTNSQAQPGLLAQYAGIFDHGRVVQMLSLNDDLPSTERAMRVAEDNKGQVLLYPYYSVRNNKSSLITVVNTTDQVKALKVNFREGQNARVVLDFNLYLGAFDVWTAALVETTSVANTTDESGAGVGEDFAGQSSVKILSNDASCTVPEFSSQQFLPFAFAHENADGLLQDMSRVTEGSIEIIEMGEVIGEDALVTIQADGSPGSCDQLVNNWSQPMGQWVLDPNVNLRDPYGSGGLSGTMSIIDVAGGLDLSYNATAIKDYSHQQQHTTPGDPVPNLSSGDNAVTRIESDEGVFFSTWDSPLEAVTALFMQEQVSNTYAIQDFIGASTEWVNFYPTKAFYADPAISGSDQILPPFSGLLRPELGACDVLMIDAYDREQQLDTHEFIAPPLPPITDIGPQHCWSVNVNQIKKVDEKQETIFDSLLDMRPYLFNSDASPIDRLHSSDSGQMRINYDSNDNSFYRLQGTGAGGTIHEIYGLPVIGFTAQAYVNSQAQPGLLANYGVISKNHNHKKIRVSNLKEVNQ